jgi:hypothetical protein
MNASVDATANVGYARIADFNGDEQAGVSPYPLNVVSGRRSTLASPSSVMTSARGPI